MTTAGSGGVTSVLDRLKQRPPTGPSAATRGGRVAAVVLVAVFAVIPFAGLTVPWVLPGPVDVLNSTGTLDVLGLGFIFAAVALGYDVLFGFTGLLSFGQVLYFALGAYGLDITLSVWNWPLLPRSSRRWPPGWCSRSRLARSACVAGASRSRWSPSPSRRRATT